MSGRPLSEFKKLNDLVSIYRPEGYNGDFAPISTSPEPGLIIFCSWMGAASKHIAKYTTCYRRLFPNASILLIQSTVYRMFTRPDISPAFEVVDSFVKDGTSDLANGSERAIILHAFSNGGANNAVLLATALLHRNSSLHLEKLILDCAPGQPEIGVISRALTISLPNIYLLRMVGFYIIYFLMFFFMFVGRVSGAEDTVSWIRRNLNSAELFSRATPRLYLCSKKDTMVRVQDVHSHAEDARDSGYEVVREEVFENAPHCALLNDDSERYWKAVAALKFDHEARV